MTKQSDVGICALVTLAVVWGCSSPAGVPSGSVGPVSIARNNTNAADIFGNMARVYTGARSYRDHGSVKTIIGDVVEETRFDTAFSRAGRFRLNFSQARGDRGSIWLRGHTAVSLWTLQEGEENHDSLDSALYKYMGVSHRASWTVPALLLHGNFFGAETVVHRLRYVRDEPIRGSNCARLELTMTSVDGDYIMWIERERGLLLQTRTRTFFPGGPPHAEVLASLPEDIRAQVAAVKRAPFMAESTTEYYPELNADIDEMLFAAPSEEGEHPRSRVEGTGQ